MDEYAAIEHAGQREYYLALSGPAAALPNLRSNTSLALFAAALHTSLELPHSYPASNILVRLVDNQPTPAAAPTASSGRRSLQETVPIGSLQESGEARAAAHLISNPAPECKPFLIQGLNQLVLAASGRSIRLTRKMLQDSPGSAVIPANAVLGVKFTPGPDLPSHDVLSALLMRSTIMKDLAGELAAVGFVAVPEDVQVAQSDSRGYPK